MPHIDFMPHIDVMHMRLREYFSYTGDIEGWENTAGTFSAREEAFFVGSCQDHSYWINLARATMATSTHLICTDEESRRGRAGFM